MSETYSVDNHFVNKDPSVRTLYDQLIKVVKKFGPIEEDPKKTSIHINRTSALIGVETRKDCILLTIKSDHLIKNPRVEKVEQISAKRFYHKVRIKALKDFDKELKGWLMQAYALAE